MQTRTVLAVSAWSFVAIVALGQTAPQHKAAIPLGKPVLLADRINTVQAGFQSAVNDLTTSPMRDMMMISPTGKRIKVKVPAAFDARKAPTFRLLHGDTLRDTQVPTFVQTEGVQLLFWAVTAGGKPLSSGKLAMDKNNATDDPLVTPALQKEVEAFATTAAPAIVDKDLYEGKIAGNDAQARPLRISKQECISCHPGFKVKDPIAIMVYMIKPNKPVKAK